MRKYIIALALIGLAAPVRAVPLDLYSDTLSWEEAGIVATPNWDNEETTFSWNISSPTPGLWHYEYVWQTDGADLSHITLELTEGAIADDFSNWQYLYASVEDESPEFGWFDPDTGNSNPGMPGSIYGFKLDLASDSAVFGFSFDTWRSPVWGDFYAKDGKHNAGGPNGGFTYAYNAGFSDPDANDGFHAAVPNGYSVSDPGTTAALLGLAMAGIAGLRQRVSRST